jgi:aminoglycoside phosphotransferase (APT) family kinase protein
MVVSGSVPGQKSPLRRLQAVQQCLAQYGRTAHMASLPSEEILAAFGIALVAPLGGRLNQHWLVETRRERLVLRRWAQSADEIDYELRLLEQIAALGWPVAPAVAGPLELDGVVWTLAPFLPGDPPSQDDPLAEQRARGRLLAAFHADLAQLGRVKQRGSWRRCEEILQDAELERVLLMHEQARSDEVRILLWHLQRARERIAELALAERPGIVIHGDFAYWNLRFQDGHLSGILDFELAHWDHRIADFALSWRGKYDAVIHGYAEVSRLEAEEWALLTPLWWAWLIDGAYQDIRRGIWDDGWTIRKLLQRSPLMGSDAVAFQ